MTDKIEILDLYEGAYLLCRGLKYQGVTIIGANGKKICAFTFEDKRAFKLVEECRQGSATVNVALLKFSIEKLKDVMFRKIRELKRQERAGRRKPYRKENYKCSDSARRREPSVITA